MPRYDTICEVCGSEFRAYRSGESHTPPRFCSAGCRSKGMRGVPCKKGKYPISPELAEKIRLMYANGTGNGEVKAFAKKHGLPRWKVTRFAQNKGLFPRQKGNSAWSEDEKAMLQRLARYCPETISARMKKKGYDRSASAVAVKLNRFRCRQNMKGYSARSLAECLGVDMKLVARAIRMGKLEADRRGTERTEAQGGDHFWIEEKNIRQYILDWLPEIDLRKVDKFWFVDLLTGEN